MPSFPRSRSLADSSSTVFSATPSEAASSAIVQGRLSIVSIMRVPSSCVPQSCASPSNMPIISVLSELKKEAARIICALVRPNVAEHAGGRTTVLSSTLSGLIGSIARASSESSSGWSLTPDTSTISMCSCPLYSARNVRSPSMICPGSRQG